MGPRPQKWRKTPIVMWMCCPVVHRCTQSFFKFSWAAFVIHICSQKRETTPTQVVATDSGRCGRKGCEIVKITKCQFIVRRPISQVVATDGVGEEMRGWRGQRVGWVGCSCRDQLTGGCHRTRGPTMEGDRPMGLGLHRHHSRPQR